MKKKLFTFFTDTKFLIALYVITAIIISLIQFYQGEKVFEGRSYTHYNNYVIFKNAYSHFINFQNPYQLWPDKQWDLYKYSPTFALLMYPLNLLPDVIGLLIWNLLNACILFIAIMQLKNFDSKIKSIILLFVLPELIISLQNSQSNGLMAGLLIIAFNLLESQKFKFATLLITLTVFIKIFGAVAFIICLLYRERWKSAVAAVLWIILLLLLPAIFIGFQQLKIDYLYWFEMLKNDHSVSIGLSVNGFLKTWFNYTAPKLAVMIAGLLLLLIPLIRTTLYDNINFKILMLANTMIWMVIFNHKAESPTFVIAIAGAAIWYFSNSHSKLNLTLLVLAFIMSSLSPTDLFPKYVRDHFINPYVLKAVPFILIWLKIEFELFTMKSKNQQLINDN